MDGVVQGGLKPFARPHLALVTKCVGIAPPSAFQNQINGLFNLVPIRITAFNDAQLEGCEH